MEDPSESIGPGSVHHCENCGYELTGIGVSGSCPECGASFNAWVPFQLRRRVRWVRVALRMMWPPGVVALLIVGLIRMMQTRPEAGMLFGLCSFLWFGLAIVMPRAIAQDVADWKWTRRGRRIPIAALTVAGFILNVLFLILVISVGIRGL